MSSNYRLNYKFILIRFLINFFFFLHFLCRVVDEDCYPYTSGSSGSVEKCRAPRKASMLSMRCRPKDREASKRTELFRTPPAYRVAQLEEDIMNEIRERGPVQGC